MFRGYMFKKKPFEEKPKVAPNPKARTEKVNWQFADEIWHLIFSFLSVGDLVKLLIVNKHFSSIANDVKKKLEQDQNQQTNLSFIKKINDLRIGQREKKLSSATWWLPAFFSQDKKPAAKTLDIMKDLFNFMDKSHSLLSLTDDVVIKNVFAVADAEIIAYPADKNSTKDLLIYFCANALRARDYCDSEQTKIVLTNFVTKLIAKLEKDKYISTDNERKLRLSMLKDGVGINELKSAVKKFTRQEKTGLYRYELISYIKSHGENGLVALFSDDVLATPGLDQEKFIAHIVQLCALVGTPATLHACLETITQKLNYENVAECFYQQCKKIPRDNYDNVIAKVILEGLSYENRQEFLYDSDIQRKLLNAYKSPLVAIVYNLEMYNRLKMMHYLFSEVFFEHETWQQELQSYLTATSKTLKIKLADILEMVPSREEYMTYIEVFLLKLKEITKKHSGEEISEEIINVLVSLFSNYYAVKYKDELAGQARCECRK